jgi:ribosomal-protein-alanine N-acetyltransferase
MPVIRRAGPGDFDAVAAIQSASPHAAHWPVADYMQYEFTVALEVGIVVGFVVWRTVGAGECELLNLAVAAEFSRRGIARQLLKALLNLPENQIFLEVRASNQAARLFYKSMGFKEINVRPEYYSSPLEAAIVMKFHSC